MSHGGREALGRTRDCPHCRATVLESASICPACRPYLRFDPGAQSELASSFPLRVEGTIRQPATGERCEYSVLVTIHDERGKEVARHVVGVGALQPAEERTFVLAVEVFTPAGAKAEAAVPFEAPLAV